MTTQTTDKEKIEMLRVALFDEIKFMGSHGYCPSEATQIALEKTKPLLEPQTTDEQLAIALMEKAREMLSFAETGINIMFAGRDDRFKKIMWLAIADAAKQYSENLP